MLELRFAQGWILWLLLVLPLLAWWARRRGRKGTATMTYSRASTLMRLGRTGLAARLRWMPAALRVGALAVGIAALARPQLMDPEDVEVEGLDIVLALDMSGSMRAVDVDDRELVRVQTRGKEPPTRFEIAREVLLRFIESRRTDRIGLIVFGEHAYTQFPLTLDYGATVQIVSRLELGDISGDATVIGNALGKALNLLRSSDAKTRLAIIITDGENTGGNIAPLQAAAFADTLGVRVFTILVGSPDQARVPVSRDFFTKRLVYEPARFAADPELLKQLAERTGGTFHRAADRDALEKNLTDILEKFEKSRIRDFGNVERTELFPALLTLALALLFAELALRLTWLRKFP